MSTEEAKNQHLQNSSEEEAQQWNEVDVGVPPETETQLSWVWSRTHLRKWDVIFKCGVIEPNIAEENNEDKGMSQPARDGQLVCNIADSPGLAATLTLLGSLELQVESVHSGKT